MKQKLLSTPPPKNQIITFSRKFVHFAALMLLFISSHQAQAQAPCPWLNDFKVDIVAKFPSNSPAQSGCPALDCDEMMYEVYIKTDLFYTHFEYSWLSILGKVTVDGRDLDGNSGFVEAVRSKQLCSPYSWDDAELSIEANGNFAFNIGDAFNPAFPANLGQVIPLVNGKALLFSVVVHAPVGSTVSIKNPSTGVNVNPYVSVTAKNNFYINCLGPLAVTFGGAASPTVTMPSPPTCPAYAYNFNGTPPTQTFMGTYLNSVDIPIVLSNLPNGTQLDEVEVLVEVKTTNYMEFGNIQSSVFSCISIYEDPNCQIKINDYEEGGFRYRRIHAIASNVTYNGGDLLRLSVLGPLNESIGDCAEIKVKFVRVKIAGNCCKVGPSAGIGESVEVCYQGYGLCNDFDLTVSESPNDPLSCSVRYKVDLSWSYLQQSFNFESLNFKLLFNSDLPNAQIQNNSICASCISIAQVGPTVFEITGNLSDAAVTKGSSFDVVFDGMEGCVNGYIFLQSTIKPIGQPQCVPELHPPYTFGGYKKCFSRLAGHMNYKLSILCGDILLEATPSDGSQGCRFDDNLVDGDPAYAFCVCTDKYPYQVKCSTNAINDWLIGVTTYDLVLISKHILGLEPFNDVFKLYAADANCSGSVTTFDLVELRKLILGIYFPGIPPPLNPNNPTVPSYKFFNAIPPVFNTLCAGDITRTIGGASETVDFWVVKTGDVSWSTTAAPTFCLTGSGSEERSARTIALQADVANIAAGEHFRIPVIFDTPASFAAMQFQLGFDATNMRLVGVTKGELENIDEQSFGLSMASDGFVRFAWYSETGEELSVKPGTVLCYLEFDALSKLTENAIVISPGGDGFRTLAYEANGLEQDIQLSRKAGDSPQMRAKVSPNPFNTNTRLMVDMPEEESLSLFIYDALGGLRHTRVVNLLKGENELLLQSTDFQNTPGMYRVELRSGSQTLTLAIVKQ